MRLPRLNRPRLPRRNAREQSFRTDLPYDERIYRRGIPFSPARIAIVSILLLLVASYFAVTKELPFRGAYEVRATFDNAANIRADSPVRIAGVNVGRVSGVAAKGDVAEVTFEVDDAGRPIREDATARIRPRMFLEGNFFIDLRPGSPSAPELRDGGTLPVTQTSTAVQLDEVLTALQTPAREGLRDLLEGYGTALNHMPTAAEDRDQDPDVHGESAAQAINDSFQYGGDAGRDSAIVNEAMLGQRPHDLSRMIAGQQRIFTALLSRERDLRELVTNFATTTGALAVESDALRETVRLLAPTVEQTEPALARLEEALPPLRRFARALEPSMHALPGTIAVSGPWLNQTGRLFSRRELLPIARQLRLAAPWLARFSNAGLRLFPDINLASLCASRVLIPSGDQVIADAFSSGVENYKEFFYSAVNFAGIGQSFDGNGPYLRLQAGGGPQLVRARNPLGGFESSSLLGSTIEAPIGTQPRLSRPPFRADFPCYGNAISNLNGPMGQVGPPAEVAVP